MLSLPSSVSGTISDDSGDTGTQLALFKEPCPPSKPFLRWAGGKTRLLSKITPYLPDQIENYFEPFLGGGAVYFAVRARVSGVCHLYDLNEDLIRVWQAVRDEPKRLMEALKEYEGLDSEEEYYAVRSASPEDEIAMAARFVYLNQTAWNSLYRVNKKGEFNVPWGDRPFRGLDHKEIQDVSAGLADATIETLDFRQSLLLPQRGDFVYLDPPYLPVSDTSKFRGYTRKKFYKPDLEDLAALCRSMSERGVNWVMSNRDTPAVRDLFDDARIVRFTTRRSVAAQNARNVQPADSPEAVVVGGPSVQTVLL